MQGVRHRVDGVDDEWNDSFLFVLRRRDPLVSCPPATQTLLDPTTVYIGACRNWRIWTLKLSSFPLPFSPPLLFFPLPLSFTFLSTPFPPFPCLFPSPYFLLLSHHLCLSLSPARSAISSLADPGLRYGRHRLLTLETRRRKQNLVLFTAGPLPAETKSHKLTLTGWRTTMVGLPLLVRHCPLRSCGFGRRRKRTPRFLIGVI